MVNTEHKISVKNKNDNMPGSQTKKKLSAGLTIVGTAI